VLLVRLVVAGGGFPGSYDPNQVMKLLEQVQYISVSQPAIPGPFAVFDRRLVVQLFIQFLENNENFYKREDVSEYRLIL